MTLSSHTTMDMAFSGNLDAPCGVQLSCGNGEQPQQQDQQGDALLSTEYNADMNNGDPAGGGQQDPQRKHHQDTRTSLSTASTADMSSRDPSGEKQQDPQQEQHQERKIVLRMDFAPEKKTRDPGSDSQQPPRLDHQQEQDTILLAEPSAKMSSTDAHTSDLAEVAVMVMQISQKHPQVIPAKMDAEQCQESARIGSSATVELNGDAVVPAKGTAEENQESKQENNWSGEKPTTQGSEQVPLWSVRKGLAPIAVAAVDSCSRGEGLLKTPCSAAAAAPLIKGGGPLEDDTPRTSVPSSEVSPTNNFCLFKNFVPTCESSTSGSSLSATGLKSRVAGTADVEESDTRCFDSLKPPQSPAEILAAAAAAAAFTGSVSSVTLAADSPSVTANESADAETAAQVDQGNESVTEVLLCLSGDAAEEAAFKRKVTTPATEATKASTSADAAAVLCSPEALSLLATPCPVGESTAGSSLRSTGAPPLIHGADTATDGTGTQKRLLTTSLNAGENIRVEQPDVVTAATVRNPAVEGVLNRAVSILNEKGTEVTGSKYKGLQGILPRAMDAQQELLNALTVDSLHEKKDEQHHRYHVPEESKRLTLHYVGEETHFCEMVGREASFAKAGTSDGSLLMKQEQETLPAKKVSSVFWDIAEDGAAGRAQENSDAKAKCSTESGDSERGGGENKQCPPFVKASTNGVERPDNSLVLQECQSQSKAAVEGSAAVVAARKVEQQQVTTGGTPKPTEDKSAGMAPLPSGSSSTEFSASAPFGETEGKGEISPVSRHSSSSTSSLTSPSCSPLLSASCGTLPYGSDGDNNIATSNWATAKKMSTAQEAAFLGEAASGSEDVSAARATGETAASTRLLPGTTADAPGDAGNGDRNVAKSPLDVKDASASSAFTAGGTPENTMPTWYVGFRLPLGAEGRQVLLRRLRRAYHAAPPTTRDAVLASHGLYFSRVPFATVSDLFKLSHLLGVFDFAVQCSHEFGGSGAAGGSVAGGGGGGSHGSKKNQVHSRNATKNNHSQRHVYSAAGLAGEERKLTGLSSETSVESSTGASSTPRLGVTLPAAAAGTNQRKSTGGASVRGSAGTGNGSGVRKGGSGKVCELISSQDTHNTVRPMAGRDRTAQGEGLAVPHAVGARDGALGRSDEVELQGALKAATVVRSRPPHQRRSTTGRSSVCRAAARQQQQQQRSLLKNIETIRGAESVEVRSGSGDRSVHTKNLDWQGLQQQLLLQQILQAGLLREQTSATTTGGTDEKSTLEAETLAAAAAHALLPSSLGGATGIKEVQEQQQQVDEQLLLLQLQEQVKASAIASRRRNSKTTDIGVQTRDLREEQEQQQQQALQSFLSEALPGRTCGLQQQQQQQQALAGRRDNIGGGRALKRSCRPTDVVQQQEQHQWVSRPSLRANAGGENSWDRQSQEESMKTPVPSTADLLPFLASAAEQLRGSGCLPPVGASGARQSPKERRKSEDKTLIGLDFNDCSGSADPINGVFFDWSNILMQNYLNTVREQQQQGQAGALLSTARGFSPAAADTRPGIVRAQSPVQGVTTPHDLPQAEPSGLQEEEIRPSKRPRISGSSHSAAAASSPVTAALSGHETPDVGGAVAGVCAALLDKEGASSQSPTSEEKALLSALLAAGGTALREQQQQRRSTPNTIDELTRLLLQLSNVSSSNGATEELNGDGAGDVGRRVGSTYTTDSAQHDSGFKRSNSSSSFNRTASSAYYDGDIAGSDSTTKSGELGFHMNNGVFSSPVSVNICSSGNACLSASRSGTQGDTGQTSQHHGAIDDLCNTATRSERGSISPSHDSQDKLPMLSFQNGDFVSAAESQQAHQELTSRCPLASRGYSEGRNSCSEIADTTIPSGYSKVREEVDGSSSGPDEHTDIFLQLTSQLQLLSAQVLQQQDRPVHQSQSTELPGVEQQYQHQVQAPQVSGSVSQGASGLAMLAAAAAAAAHEESVPGRLCSAEKATEYAASVQSLQLVELLQVQHRVSRLLSLFPRTSNASAAPSPRPAPVTAAPFAPYSPGASLPDPAATAAADVPATAAEPSAALLAALASTILEGKAAAAVMNSATQVGETPAGVGMLGLASGSTDLTSLAKSTGSTGLLQQSVNVYNPEEQQQQRVQLSNRASCRGSTNKSNNSKRVANRNSSKGNSGKSGGNKGNTTLGNERNSASAAQEVGEVHPAGGSVPPARGKTATERSAALPKQQTGGAGHCVSHSNSFSTCCSEDVQDLCTSSSSSVQSTHGSSGRLFDGVCAAKPTYDRSYTHESYTCAGGQTIEDATDICMM